MNVLYEKRVFFVQLHSNIVYSSFTIYIKYITRFCALNTFEKYLMHIIRHFLDIICVFMRLKYIT